MVDRPILFSAPMVRALLDGRKTQTRRVIKPQPSAQCAGFQRVFAQPPYFEAVDAGGKPICAFPEGKGSISPYPSIRFAIGDRLWVKETWNTFVLSQDLEESWPTAKIPKSDPRDDEGRNVVVVDHATMGLPGTDAGKGPWRPSIFMPRWASRLTLTVTDVRVQRLQDISGEDAIAEGIEGSHGAWKCYLSGDGYEDAWTDPVQSYRTLWDSINGPGAW